MGGQAWITYAAYSRMLCQPVGDLQSRSRLPLHAQSECFYSAQRQKRIKWPLNCACSILQESQPVAKFGIVTDDHNATDHVGVAVEVFGGGMHDKIEAVFKRPLSPRTGERIVADGRNLLRPGYGGDAFKINHLEHWISRSLEPNQSCAGTYRCCKCLGVRKIDIGRLDAR